MDTNEIKNREKQLYKNTGILAMGTLCSKAFQFLLLPLYTNVLSTEDYGSIDVLTTIASLIIPLVTLQVSSAVFRFIIDCKDEYEKEKIVSSSFFIEIISLLVSTLFIVIINQFSPIDYCGLFIVFILSSVCNDFVQNVIRGLGNTVVYSILNFIEIVTSVMLNIMFIVCLKMNGEAILLASTLSCSVGVIWGSYKVKIWNYVKFRGISKVTCDNLIRYSFPLIPNAVSWWIANASDRLIINIFLGASFNGIYAAANKIPALYTTIFNVFNLAWSESVSRGCESNVQDRFINEMLERCIRLFGCICLGIISCIAVFFDVLIGSQYKDAYNHIWILMIAIFINSLCSIFGGIFTAYKKSGIIGASTVLGAVVNIMINVALISGLQIYAASISTLISYVVILVVRYCFSRKIISIRWPVNSIMEFVCALIVVSIGYFNDCFMLKILCLISVFVWSIINNKEFLYIIIVEVKNRLL